MELLIQRSNLFTFKMVVSIARRARVSEYIWFVQLLLSRSHATYGLSRN